jgi:uncharacterized membrane protein
MPAQDVSINDGAFQPADGKGADLVLLDVRLTPHRSLARKQFHVLMGVFALAGTVSSLPVVIFGAWPVAGFMGLDVLLLYIAFRANYRAARAYEDICVTPLELIIAKVSAKGRKAEWRFHPAWVRLDKVEHVEFGLMRLALCSRGRSVEVAGFLGPDAKADFASTLTRALSEARRGPRFS